MIKINFMNILNYVFFSFKKIVLLHFKSNFDYFQDLISKVLLLLK